MAPAMVLLPSFGAVGADNDENLDAPRLLGICQPQYRRADSAARCLGLYLVKMETVHSMAYKPIGDNCGVKSSTSGTT